MKANRTVQAMPAVAVLMSAPAGTTFGVDNAGFSALDPRPPEQSRGFISFFAFP